jgi:hypothetical protein
MPEFPLLTGDELTGGSVSLIVVRRLARQTIIKLMSGS